MNNVEYFDHLLDKQAAARNFAASVQVNAYFKIVPQNGVFAPCYREEKHGIVNGQRKTWDGWSYMYTQAEPGEKATYTGMKLLTFATWEEAEEFCQQFVMAMHSWGFFPQMMAGDVCSQCGQEITLEEVIFNQHYCDACTFALEDVCL